MATRESTRTRLLDATDELLFDAGAVHTPVDQILERAGVSPATLYRAYGSKEELIAAALDRRQRAWLETWDAAVERAADDRGRLLAVFDTLDDFRQRPVGARWCAFLGTAAAYVDPPAVLAAAIRQDTESMRERLRLLAEPVAGPAAAELAESLMLLVSGDLAMRLRPGSTATTARARALAELLVERAAPGP